jgi:stearoyl-CoA desaturase (delta-9 desaturase)
MFKLSVFWERAFYLLTYLAQGVSFLHPRGYAIMHIKHHQHSDSIDDPHSPTNNKNLITMMLNTYEKYTDSIED